MKVVSKTIECVAFFDPKGKPRPIKFRYINEDELFVVIKVDKITHQKLLKQHFRLYFYNIKLSFSKPGCGNSIYEICTIAVPLILNYRLCPRKILKLNYN